MFLRFLCHLHGELFITSQNHVLLVVTVFQLQSMQYVISGFHVFLTVHLSVISQLDAQNLAL